MITILVEGQSTEPTYFAHLATLFELRPYRLVSASSTDPLRMLEEIIGIQKSLEQSPFPPLSTLPHCQEFWLVLDAETPTADRTRWHRLQRTLQRAAKHHVKLALSEPFFEFWLLLHLRNLPASGVPWDARSILSLLQQAAHLPGSKLKSAFPFDKLITRNSVLQAIRQNPQCGLARLLQALIL